MASFSFDVTSYSVWLSPTIGWDTRNLGGRAMITCRGDAGLGKEFRCEFRFHDEEELPESVYNSTSRVASIFLHVSFYPWYVDLLRNERPLRVTIDRVAPKFTSLATASEATGDGERLIGG